MNVWFLLFLLLPLCQVSTASGEKGCIRTEFCKRPGWKCCYTPLCNA